MGRRDARMLGVPRAMLPRAVSSRGPLAETAPGMIGPRAIPIGAVIGDQQSALYGQGAVAPGDSKATYGTGAFLLMHTGGETVTSRNRLLTTAALGPAGEPAYALEGSVFIAGAAIQWLRDGLACAHCRRERSQRARAAKIARSPTWCRPSSDSARHIGTPMRAARSSASPAAPLAPTSCARRSTRSPTRCATSWSRWRRTAGIR